jgi:hypothetical protein
MAYAAGCPGWQAKLLKRRTVSTDFLKGRLAAGFAAQKSIPRASRHLSVQADMAAS